MRIRHRQNVLITRRPLRNLSIHTHVRNRQNNNIARIIERQPVIPLPTRANRHIHPPSHLTNRTLLTSETSARIARRTLLIFTLLTCQFRHIRSCTKRKRIATFIILQNTLNPFNISMCRITTRIRCTNIRIRVTSLWSNHFTPSRPTRTR